MSEEEKKYELIPKGKYFVNIEDADLTHYPSGRRKITLKMRIRKDIDQKDQGRCVFDDLWQDWQDVTIFDRIKIKNILKAINPEVSYLDNNEVSIIDYFKNKNIQILISSKHSDYYKKDVNIVTAYLAATYSAAPKMYQKSSAKKKTVEKPKENNDSDFLNMEDDKLPF